jgi:DNA-cytosine methyltransferase
MIVGSLFSGAGLLDAGLHQAGHEHAWFVEREPDRRALLARRWPGRPVHDDVRTVGAHHLEPVDCIAGGFPCKGASTAGKRTGLAHPETALWAEFARIVGELRPRYVVVENVANILALHDGAVWGTVLGDLAALGFDVAWDCVPAAAFGAPHGRDRVVAIAADAGRERGELCGGNPDKWQARADLLKVKHGNGNGHGTPLAVAVKMLPTPTARGVKDTGAPAEFGRKSPETAADDAQAAADADRGRQHEGGRTRDEHAQDRELQGRDEPLGRRPTSRVGRVRARRSADGKPSTGLRLNPSFVGWMMGTPSCSECGREWTDPDCPHSATAFTSTSAGSSETR